MRGKTHAHTQHYSVCVEWLSSELGMCWVYGVVWWFYLMHTHVMVHDDDDDDDYSGSSFMMAVPNMEQPLPHICIWSLQQQRYWRRQQRQNDFSNRNETEVHILHGKKYCKRPSYSTVLTKQREKCRTRRVNVCVCCCMSFGVHMRSAPVYLLRLMNLKH